MTRSPSTYWQASVVASWLVNISLVWDVRALESLRELLSPKKSADISCSISTRQPWSRL